MYIQRPFVSILRTRGHIKSIVRRRTGALNRRYLSPLEQNMYQGRKLIPNMLTVDCSKRVDAFYIRTALEDMTKRHPMLRMCIREDEHGPFFVENLEKEIDLFIYENTDITTVAQEQYIRHFENGCDIWRFNLIKTSGNLLEFVFSMHHSAFDFPYSYVTVLDFLETLMIVQNHSSISVQNRPCYSFQPSCDQIPDLQPEKIGETDDTSKGPSIALPALQAYNYYFRDEINYLSPTKRLKATCEIIDFSPYNSTKFLSVCRRQNVSSTSALLALLTSSFSQLLCSKGCTEPVMYNFVAWTNLRRYMKTDSLEFYPGMAVVPNQMSILVHTTLKDADMVWNVARDINNQLRTALDNKLPLKVLHEVYPKWLKEGRKKGKSENVFSLSNVHRVDNIKPEVQKHFTLKDYRVIADLDVDYSPIFLVLSSIKNDTLNIGTAYSSNYTSRDTVQTFMSYLKESTEDVIR